MITLRFVSRVNVIHVPPVSSFSSLIEILNSTGVQSAPSGIPKPVRQHPLAFFLTRGPLFSVLPDPLLLVGSPSALGNSPENSRLPADNPSVSPSFLVCCRTFIHR